MPHQSTDPKYTTFLKVLDRLRAEAPESDNRYHPDPKNPEEINAARSLAFAHLFLMIKCGLDAFRTRAKHVTDGKSDGGLDAFYIDRETRTILLIQSKFRATPQGFKEKEISSDELVRMELERILKGKQENTNSTRYNGKILDFQRELQSIGDIALYEYRVVLLSNLTRYNESQVKQLLGGFPYEVFDFRRTYDELVFPLCSATYFDPDRIQIEINLSQKQQASLSQTINVQGGESEVTVLFVPTSEIARVMSKYKNALLKYNPRNYLSLSHNPVNKKIRESIVSLPTNEFAILNNGITFTAHEVAITHRAGKENVGQLILVGPQIINGGQTACTLSEIYEKEYPDNPDIFAAKEVMLKIITLQDIGAGKPALVEAISNATNRQTRIDEPDRRSNSPIFMELQRRIFSNYGYYFERKEGEFYYGIDSGVLSSKLVVDRAELVKALLAFTGDPARARGSAETELFAAPNIAALFTAEDSFQPAFFAHRLLFNVKAYERLHKRGKYLPGRRLGNAFKYGKFAVVAAAGVNNPTIPADLQELESAAAKIVDKVIKKWSRFEAFAVRGASNIDYFRPGEKDFDNYYKGRTLNQDLKAFWRGAV